jgi:osmotically-inducible protein OsmY
MRAARRYSERPPQRALPVALAALLAAVSALAADPQAEQREADARQKLYVRRALNDDAGLAPYAAEVWVDVRGTVVILGGQVPSAMLKQRAHFLAGQVKGIGEVRSDGLSVVRRADVTDLPSPFAEGATPPGTLAGNHHGDHTTEVPHKTEVAVPDPPARPLHEAVTLLPPRPLTAVDELPATVEALRRKEERFRRLTVEVRQKTVYLRGTVLRWADVSAFTAAVRRLPGVAAVIVDDVHVDPTGGRTP